MSTKIYDGCRLRGVRTALELQSFCRRLREKMEPVHRRLCARYAANIATSVLDAKALGGKLADDYKPYSFDPGKYPRAATYAVMRMLDEAKGEKGAPGRFRHGFTAMFFPLRGRILAMPFALEPELNEVWTSMPEVEEYGYWNNTDRPEGVSAKRWDRRRVAWDQALPGSGIPSECGLAFELAAHPHFPNLEELVEAATPKAERAREYAVEMVAMSRMREEVRRERGEGAKAEISDYMNARRWAHDTPDGQSAVALHAAEIVAKLPDVTKDTLTEETPAPVAAEEVMT